ncbi:TDT family transporter [Phytomonospora endophytica]|uniref:C4-dicarboxylate transporter/malic acid transport protein n=1 Tax=Phytomonospora endophytica TaxID=714109 RepID=A0A841F7L7_9ACTN|nr:TDT family transporter [Phytomonospora endophytica]MBB6033031.1 C4-dicarboxylate transporter/malic acid transport protein [Phytomonospora endophytica]GIG65258.1 C4-dicarboxylate ABC transporter [Phytomonospora endophytica]
MTSPALTTQSHTLVRHIGPNWFASVMGTGIVANAAATLPHRPPWLHAAAGVVWALAALWLVTLTVAFAAQWLRDPARARGHHADAVAVQFYGAPPMALLTVGAGTLLYGPPLLGGAAVPVAVVLWALGTVGGLVSAVSVPYAMFTREGLDGDAPVPAWLMPVVPPMVSAATGAALVPHAAAGQARLTLLLACYAMFGLSLLATVVVLPQVWSRLARHKVGAAATVPTLWIVLGPLGQSVTAAGALGAVAGTAADAHLAEALALFGVVYGVCVFGFALLWMSLAVAVTVRTVRRGLPFAPTWWSFTFPLGTCVTAASVLAAHTGAVAYGWLAVGLYAGLAGAWGAVVYRTGRFLAGR